MHRRIADQALARLSGDRSTYFARVIDMIGRDHGGRSDLNLVYLLLACSMERAPIYLPEGRFIGEMLGFMDERRTSLGRILFGPEFLASGTGAFEGEADAFCGRLADICLRMYREGEIADDEPSKLTFSWPDYAEPSPYKSEDPDAE